MAAELKLVAEPTNYQVQWVTPEELITFDPQSLSDPKYFEIIRQTVLDARVRVEPQHALLVLNALQTLLRRNDQLSNTKPELFKSYQLMQVFIQANTLVWQSEEVQRKIFKNHLLFLLSQETDLTDKVKLGYLHYGATVAESIRFSDYLLYAMRQNQETLGDKNINVKGQTIMPTITAWLEDYEEKVPGNVSRKNIDQVSYINSSKNAQSLNERDRQILLDIIKLYDFLRFPAATIDESPRPLAIPSATPPTPRTVTPAPPPIPTSISPPAPAVPEHTVASDFELIQQVDEDAVAAAENGLLTATEGDVTKLRAELYKAITENKRDAILAGLLLLARLSDLKKVLLEDKKVAAIYEKNVVPELAKRLDVQANKFTSSYSPAHLREFLRFILERALKDEQKAAAYGMQIEEVMQSTGSKDYAHMVYFDTGIKKYRWAEAQVDQHDRLN